MMEECAAECLDRANHTGTQIGDTVLVSQGGIGAIARSVAGKLCEHISVKDFGAIGDGITDDTAAIQAAVDKAAEAGATIWLPRGRFLVSSTITVSSSHAVNFEGEMCGQVYDPTKGAHIIIGAAMDYAIKYVAPNPAERWRHGGGLIRGLSFIDLTGSGGMPGTRPLIAALYLKDFSLSRVENCRFTFLNGGAIKTGFATMSSISGCIVRYSGSASHGVFRLVGDAFAAATQSFIVSDCRFEVCHGSAYIEDNEYSYDVQISACKFEASTDHFPTSSQTFIKLNATRFLVSGCSFNRTQAVAVDITADARGQIDSCTFATGEHANIALRLACFRSTVTGNRFEGASTEHAIQDLGQQNIFSSNSFYYAGAVILGHCSTFTGNAIIRTISTLGYAVRVPEHCTVVGNTFDGDNNDMPAAAIVLVGDKSVVSGNISRRWSNNVFVRSEASAVDIFGNAHDGEGASYSESVAMSLNARRDPGYGRPLSVTKTIDLPLVNHGGRHEEVVGVIGAVLGDIVQVSLSTDTQGLIVQGRVSSPNFVKIAFQNESGVPINLSSATIFVQILRGII